MADVLGSKKLSEIIQQNTGCDELTAQGVILEVVAEYQQRAANYFQKTQFDQDTYDTGRGFDDLGDGESAAYGLMRAIWNFDNGCKAEMHVVQTTAGHGMRRVDLKCERELNHELTSVDTHKSGDYEWVSTS